ncbi:CCDC90 family protein [Methylobacterium sp. J-030]|uniref:coiled-coil domain-containing protein n=1 Tax=Methylobacterium sp. J-030 TaxID=2836627 RepID=UPI001FBAB35D|nr:coiled-coil domain-containing protein [Methylobacterium sp. J-030]MCJ2073280.1 CCDC90 family protein [Methylobacterium sp. J-030]
MTAVAFDTLRFVRTLREKAKMSSEQAEGLADAIAEAIQNDLATKTDIAAVRTDVEALRLSTKTDIAMVRTDIEALRLSTKADLREAELRLEAKIEATKGEIIKWVVGSIGFQALVIVGAVVALARGLH